MSSIRSQLLWLAPVALFILISPFTPWIDLTLAQMSYSSDTHSFQSSRFYDFMYYWGTFPGQLLIAASLTVLLLSYPIKHLKSMRMPALFLVLTLAIGAGFITHALLKDHWGRPRPRQLIEFGGIQEYRPFWKPNFSHQPEPSKSFPCGHCTMGFAFFAFYFLGKRLNKKWMSVLGVVLALALGVGLGITRIAQGGHFFSDVLATALIMWLTAFAFDKLLFEEGAVSA